MLVFNFFILIFFYILRCLRAFLERQKYRSWCWCVGSAISGRFFYLELAHCRFQKIIVPCTKDGVKDYTVIISNKATVYILSVFNRIVSSYSKKQKDALLRVHKLR